MRALFGVLTTALWLGTGSVRSEGLNLTAAERAAFRAEVRALLLDEPELVAGALAPPSPAAIYREAIDSDLALIEAQAAKLFSSEGATLLGTTGPIAFASFARPDGETARMLAAYAESRGVRIALRDPDTHADLMQSLGLDTVPSHVFAALMVRGEVPAVVLDRYLP